MILKYYNNHILIFVKEENMKKKYSIGLDIGVGSVGWACITSDFNVLTHNGRYAIGTREFTSAETAEERRVYRGTRRRYNRRIKRLQLLQQVMEPLFKQDPTFFHKTDEQNKHFWRNSNHFENHSLSETLKEIGQNPKKYPTIYHLRHALIKKNEKFNPKLIYLALHHLVKFRGHFLNENMIWNHTDEKVSIEDQLDIYFKELSLHGYEEKKLTDEIKKIEKLLKDKTLTNSDKRSSILKLIGRDWREPISLLVGLNTTISKLFPHSENIELYVEEKLKLSFSDEDISEVYEKLTDEEKLIIDKANVIFQHITLHELLGESFYVSEAKVKSYEQFGNDLSILKRIYNNYLGETAYRLTFITSKRNLTKYQKTRNEKLLCKFDRFIKVKNKYEEAFYKDIKKELENILNSGKVNSSDKKIIESIIDRIDRNQFLQKQKTHLNAAIPHQNNVYEAESILKNQQKFHPEITNEMIEKVKSIIRFRIPYYIGPLVKENNRGEFGWVIRKKEGVPVLPWNINEVVNRSETAEKFIDRMTNFCIYLTDEKVLPKHSLLYEKFEVLNELNGIQIRANYEQPNHKYRLGKEEKQWILQNVFNKYKNVTHRLLKEKLKQSPYKHIILDENVDSLKEIYGTQQESRFGSSLSTFIDMTNIFGEINEHNFSMIEEIIYWITVFEDKNILKEKIVEKYPHISKKQLKQILRLNYKGWGRLSKKLLDELPADQVNNWTIIDVMEQEAKVFMEVLSVEKYDLNDRIAKINQSSNEVMTKITYKDIKELQGSPALKKAIWQAVQIVEELVDIFGEPENIMIEFAREDGIKKRTEDRKKRLEQIRKSVSQDEKELKDFLNKHSHYEEADYKDQRLYLYLTQMGKCLYSGEPLNINRLQDYDVDHIYPRSFVKDDSFDNLALVKTEMNHLKGDLKMPLQIIPDADKHKMRTLWKKLFENKLISQKKYYRLQKEEFTDQDKESFFARQLVETRQITKHVKNLFEERFENTEIHTVNAEIVSNLRKHSNIEKIRDLNSKHHAVDAAFAAIIIQFIINKYGHNFLDFNFKYKEAQKKWKQLLKQYGKNFFVFSDIDRYDKFVHYETGEIISGRQFLQSINDEIPWQSTKKIGTEEAAFYKQTLFSPRVKEAKYLSSKTSKGVYDEMKTDSTYLISYKERDNRGRIQNKTDFVDLYVIEKYQNKSLSEKEFAIFLANKIAKGEVLDAKIHTKINKYQKIIYDDFPFYYVSSKELHNAKQLVLRPETLQNLYQIISRNKDDEINIEHLRETFNQIGSTVITEYKTYLPDSRIDVIKDYPNKIENYSDFINGIEELFKTTNASAARSKLFGHRYQKKLAPQKVKFVHESITGLRHRKPKSYRHELWSL